MTDSPLRTAAHVAKRLGVSEDTVYRLVTEKRIGHVRVGIGRSKPRIRFHDEDVEAFIARNRQAAIATAAPSVDELVPALQTSAPRRRRRGPSTVLDLPGSDRYVN